jgi:hypothetical protein
MPDYLYAVYNNQPQNISIVQEKLDNMSADGWHIHTASLQYSEIYILWEKDGSALANRVAPHLATAPDVQASPPVDPSSVTKPALQDMARKQGLPVSGTKAELAESLAAAEILNPSSSPPPG